MAPEELVGEGVHDSVEGEEPLLRTELGIEDHLEEHIAEFFLHVGPVPGLDRRGEFVAFLERGRHDGCEALLEVPGTARGRVAEALHDAQQVMDVVGVCLHGWRP